MVPTLGTIVGSFFEVVLVHFALFERGEHCCMCGHTLFSSSTKFAHSTPWPAFAQTLQPNSVAKVQEKPGALKVSCGQCGAGLGHEFLGEGPKGASRF